MPNLKNKDNLLRDISRGIERRGRAEVKNIKVIFVCGDEEYDFSLPAALEALATDLYWDERGNWSEAARATVETF
jgi:hypothetical protein